jgi:hypothetical protein
MLEIELDIFSGRPNPKWTLSETEEKILLDMIISDPTQISPVHTHEEQFGLGYRGLIVREVKTNDGIWDRTNRILESPIPWEFRIGSKHAKNASTAEWLLQTSKDHVDSGVTDELYKVAAKGVTLIQSKEEGGNILEGAEENFRVLTWTNCGSSYFINNLDKFNDPAHISLNNCYCFASNIVADIRYATPGKYGGRDLTNIVSSEVINGLTADGWKKICEKFTLIIALVIWPGTDFHFYRLMTSGPTYLWGHKPGGTRAVCTDNNGKWIQAGLTPENINRGPYTDFCGYFYQSNLTAHVK